MNAKTCWFIFLVIGLNGLVILEAVMSYYDRMLTAGQMIVSGKRQGLPLLAHGAIWGDFFWITPIVAYILVNYSEQRKHKEWMDVALAMIFINGIMHLLWIQDKRPNCLGWNRHITEAGFVHWIYMGIAMSVIGLYYLRTFGMGHYELIIISAILCLHVLVGSNKILDVLNPPWWGRTFLGDVLGWFTIITTDTVLVWRCEYLLNHR